MAEHSYNVVSTPNAKKDNSFRCNVVGKNAAMLRVGRTARKVSVREASGSGFTIGLDAKTAKRIKCGKRYELRYDERRLLVLAEAFVETIDGEARLRIGTVHEYEPRERWAFRLPFTSGRKIMSHDSAVNNGAAYGGFVLVLFCVMALPGIGEQLGTAPKIHEALALMQKNIVDVYTEFTK